MEDFKNDTRKRVRDDDSDADSYESKRVHSGLDDNSSGSCVDSDGSEPVQVEPDSYEVNEIKDDILNILDETENVTTVQGLDSVIKSFEEEILAPGQDLNPTHVPVSDNLNPNLGYLLEASDDELDGVDLSGFFWFEEDIRNNEAFGFMGYDAVADDNGGGYVTIDGLFDYADPGDLLWRSETLQAM
ncbi:hypothetical protein MTR_8g104140 [Medicago truncatula]|uniref:Uncharacterized protein n=1 Tax=Medicago truncatula TaxID=3880 RepID=G7L9N7_MEDTR|nr:hypothetical protein MTR_8g104140 [Medicago truncatula]